MDYEYNTAMSNVNIPNRIHFIYKDFIQTAFYFVLTKLISIKPILPEQK